MRTEQKMEQRLRRKLRRNGYLLRKTPSRSSQRELLGVGFMVIDGDTNCIVLGSYPWPYSASLDHVDHWASALWSPKELASKLSDFSKSRFSCFDVFF